MNKPCGCVECPGVSDGGDKRGLWKPGDRVLVRFAENDDGFITYGMATLLYIRCAYTDVEWAFHVDGETYPQYEGGPDHGFCVERWLHVPNALERLAEIELD